mgnify:CR=1 FL=1
MRERESLCTHAREAITYAILTCRNSAGGKLSRELRIFRSVCPKVDNSSPDRELVLMSLHRSAFNIETKVNNRDFEGLKCGAELKTKEQHTKTKLGDLVHQLWDGVQRLQGGIHVAGVSQIVQSRRGQLQPPNPAITCVQQRNWTRCPPSLTIPSHRHTVVLEEPPAWDTTSSKKTTFSAGAAGAASALPISINCIPWRNPASFRSTSSCEGIQTHISPCAHNRGCDSSIHTWDTRQHKNHIHMESVVQGG